MQMSDVSVSPTDDDTEFGFLSTDQRFYLREENGWWAVDLINAAVVLSNSFQSSDVHASR